MPPLQYLCTFQKHSYKQQFVRQLSETDMHDIMYNANAIPGGGDGGWCYVFPKRYMARALSASGLLRVRRIPLMSKRMTPQWPRKVGKQMTLR